MPSTLETNLQTDTITPKGTQAEPSGFSWYELHTPDAAAAAAFYEPVLGWKMQDAGMTNRTYTIASVGEVPVGGVLEKPAGDFTPGKGAHWIGYIGVDDVQLFSKRVLAAGGTVHRGAEEIPGVGTFAVVADPQGGIFVLFQPLQGVTPPAHSDPCAPGMPAWHDFGALDWKSAFDFYAGLFGWTKADAIDMGSGSVYQIFAIGPHPAGGMMTLPPNAQGPGWLFYFHVEEIEAAVERVRQHGGKVIHGPSPVPGGQQIAHCLDPQGAIFGIVTPRTA